MPLTSVEVLDAATETKLAIWRITETVDDFLKLLKLSNDSRKTTYIQCKSTSRQCEILAVRALLDNLLGRNAVLSHNSDGRPTLSNNYNISISHTKGWAAVIVSQKKNVSVDIEYISPRVLKIKDKFLRNDENANTATTALLHWCAKETLYKLNSSDHLELMQMRINSISENETKGIIRTEYLITKTIVPVFYNITNEYVLTYTM